MLYTEQYKEQQCALHQDPNYGVKAVQYLGPIKMAAQAFGAESLLDYGCGPHKRLEGSVALNYTPYDIVEPYNEDPEPHDLLVAADVLEHIEPECLDDVLSHMDELAVKGAFFSVHTQAAKKTLPDGRNAHLIQEPPEWWFNKISDYFEIQQFMRVSDREFFVICKN